MRQVLKGIEWPTLAILILTYLLWSLGTTVVYTGYPFLAIVLTGVTIAQFSSLQHEVLHGHPFRSRALNEALVFPGLTLTVPFERFRDTHLGHHHDPILTDPYDDPESNFFDPAVWSGLPRPVQMLLQCNNALLGRMILGPVIGAVMWLRDEAGLMLAGDRVVQRAWVLHLVGLVPVIGWLWVAAMPWWAYLLAAWIGHGLLKIRTFLEHRAHEVARGRTVIIEDRGPLSVLFLNNNYHAVHHMHPGLAWYRLPAQFAAKRDQYLQRNEGYFYQSYLQVFKDHLLTAKDPVPHPVWPVKPGSEQASEGGRVT
jgi:fatty acid desaturase